MTGMSQNQEREAAGGISCCSKERNQCMHAFLLSSDCPLLHSPGCSTSGMVPPILDRSSHLSQTNQNNNNPQQECLETHPLDSRVSQVGW